MFVHLHNHTHYSILEGLPKPRDYVEKAKTLGMSAVAITDTGNLHGCHELYKECKSAGIKPILGIEIYVQSSLDSNLNHKLVLLAKNLTGYRNIISLASKASLDNAGKIPFVTLEDIKQNSSDIICLSGPISSEIAYYILSGKSESEIVDKVKEYQSIFGADNYFLELIYHDDIPKQKLITDYLIELNKKYSFPVVATNDCFYVEKDDKKTQDVIQALGSGHEIDNPDRPTKINGDYSFFSTEEMQSIFGFIPEALENTVKISDLIDIEIETGGVLIPTFELPEDDQKIYENALQLEKTEKLIQKLDSSEWYLRYLSFKGMNWRYDSGFSDEEIFELIKKLDKSGLNKELTETSPEELKDLSLTYYTDKKKDFLKTLDKKTQDKIERLEYELVVIHEMGFDAYFLIVADYINWSRDNNVPVGPGRGSAAGSLMAYLSGITDIDPLPYDLLFERFLNPARISMPDIDTDFADNGRDRVVEYCREKYGADHVAQICTFGTFAARAAVKDVGRVMGIPFAEMNELAKLIPEKPGTKLKGALEDSIEFKEAYDTNKKYREIIDNALKIEGNVRQLGVHACAVIIAPEPMTNFTALAHPPKDAEAIVTQYSAYPLEDLGLLKMDFLGLRNLTIIQRAQKIIKANKGVDVDVLGLPMDDEKVFELFSAGDTTGVFQFESDGMRKYLKDLKPNLFEDLIAMVSLYRPGPLAYIPTYVNRKHGKEEIVYMTDKLIEILKKSKISDQDIEKQKEMLESDLKKILDVTYGIAVYQEQLMFIVQYMAGFSLGEADLLRRGVGKKKIEVIEQLKGEFIQRGADFKGYHPDVTRYIYEEMIQPAANYSFNKSHAACYAYISYQTAYLKAHYESEFMTSMMVSDEENMDRITLEVGECESKGISVLPPSVNESLKHFTYIDDKNIRFGLKAIKGVGDGPIEKIIEARNKLGRSFENLEEFIEACGKEVINKKSLEALIKSGAMDELGTRKQMWSGIPDIIKFCRRDEYKKETSQIGLFDDSSEFEDKLILEEVGKFSYEERLFGEKEMIGFFVTGHPLDGLGRYCIRRSSNTKKLKMSMLDLLELDKKDNPEKYEEKKEEQEKPKEKKKSPEREICQAVGYIKDLRKIITKSGKPMYFLVCEGYDFDFEVVVFTKDAEKYADKLEIGKIVIANGYLSINFEYGRKSIQTKELKLATISQVREQARDLGLFDDKRRFVNLNLNEVEEETSLSQIPHLTSPKGRGIEGLETNNVVSSLPLVETRERENDELEGSTDFESQLEQKIEENKQEKQEKNHDEFVIDIPVSAVKQDLHDLKEFMQSLEPGYTNIFLNLRGQKIDTKMSISDTDSLVDWISEKW